MYIVHKSFFNFLSKWSNDRGKNKIIAVKKVSPGEEVLEEYCTRLCCVDAHHLTARQIRLIFVLIRRGRTLVSRA